MLAFKYVELLRAGTAAPYPLSRAPHRLMIGDVLPVYRHQQYLDFFFCEILLTKIELAYPASSLYYVNAEEHNRALLMMSYF